MLTVVDFVGAGDDDVDNCGSELDPLQFNSAFFSDGIPQCSILITVSFDIAAT